MSSLFSFPHVCSFGRFGYAGLKVQEIGRQSGAAISFLFGSFQK